ncbi:hypothetical protein PMAYCL1PPCAC_00199 [Pristionchus mayeri]|uniref:NR LBD domain-containing protein n=1 Tax=Pristionchus mayeri TaxID=1317129 RepID=A0AAN5C5S9_9BILA|nr:hypothetical protein PMAYCL1PPCAC_00199 [Pristionchus mayeri]
MGSVLTVVDMNDDDQCLSEDEGGNHRELMKESGRDYMLHHLALITPIFKKAQISRTELYALLALTLCETDTSSGVSSHVISELDELRREVLHDLQRHYKEEMGLDDFSMRLGNLMTINHCIRECGALFDAYFRMHTTVFDQYGAIKDIFL